MSEPDHTDAEIRPFRIEIPQEDLDDLQYRLTKWRMDRMRKRFSVHKGGRDGNGNWVH